MHRVLNLQILRRRWPLRTAGVLLLLLAALFVVACFPGRTGDDAQVTDPTPTPQTAESTVMSATQTAPTPSQPTTTSPQPTPNPPYTPTPAPIARPIPIPLPLPTPSATPSSTPTPPPTPEPTPAPTPSPTPLPKPTDTPTPEPTPEPHFVPNPTPENPPPLTALHDIASMVEEVRGAVVSVVALAEVQQGFTTDTRPQSGSGVIIDFDGHILTNHHVIEGAVSITVTLDDGRKLDAELVGSDPLTDLALLRVDEDSLSFIPFADPSAVRVGEWVIAIGNALALPGGPSVTLGIVSALDRSWGPDQTNVLYGLVQTDATINPGNSGGPLMNLSGEIVGINTAVLRGGSVEGIGFAVGGETAIHVSNQLIEWGKVRWPWLGVIISELDAEIAADMDVPFSDGILVRSLVADGPAESGGLLPDDIILSIDGEPTSGVRDFVQLLRLKFAVDQSVNVEVWRDGQVGYFQVRLGERPTSPL